MIARPDDPDTASVDRTTRPALSVSARDAPPPPTGGAAETSASLLRRLVDEAAAAALRFQEAMDGAARREARATAASVALQERLRLGAKMLHAQQGQIERLERLVSELQSARVSAELVLSQLRERGSAISPQARRKDQSDSAEP